MKTPYPGLFGMLSIGLIWQYLDSGRNNALTLGPLGSFQVWII